MEHATLDKRNLCNLNKKTGYMRISLCIEVLYTCDYSIVQSL